MGGTLSASVVGVDWVRGAGGGGYVGLTVGPSTYAEVICLTLHWGDRTVVDPSMSYSSQWTLLGMGNVGYGPNCHGPYDDQTWVWLRQPGQSSRNITWSLAFNYNYARVYIDTGGRDAFGSATDDTGYLSGGVYTTPQHTSDHAHVALSYLAPHWTPSSACGIGGPGSSNGGYTTTDLANYSNSDTGYEPAVGWDQASSLTTGPIDWDAGTDTEPVEYYGLTAHVWTTGGWHVGYIAGQ